MLAGARQESGFTLILAVILCHRNRACIMVCTGNMKAPKEMTKVHICKLKIFQKGANRMSENYWILSEHIFSDCPFYLVKTTIGTVAVNSHCYITKDLISIQSAVPFSINAV